MKQTAARRGILLAALASMLVAALLYSYSLRLPLFLDDGLLYAMIRDYGPEGVPGLRFWGGSLSYQYFRPLGFSVLELSYDTTGYLNPLPLHAFNMMMLVIACGALAALVGRVTGQAWVGLLAGVLLAVYPFNFRSTTWVASLFHVMGLASMSVALLASLRWMDRRQAGALLLALGAGAFAIFSQESTIILLPLLALLLLIVYRRAALRSRHAWMLLIALALLIAIFAYLWLAIPRPASGPLNLQLANLPASLAVFAQGLIYPVVALLRRLTLQNAQTIPLLALTLGMVMLGLWLAGRRWLPLALWGVAWFGLAALPAALLLPTDYLKGSVHVMTLASGGAVLFWVAAAAGVLRPSSWKFERSLRLLIASILLAGALFVSLSYGLARRAEALRLSDYTWALFELVRDDPQDVVLINAPAFLSVLDSDRWLLTSSEATMFAEGSYTDYGQFFEALTGQPYPRIVGLVYEPGFVPPPSYVFAPYWNENPPDFTARLRDFRRIIVTRFAGDAFEPLYVGGAGLPGPDVALARFEAASLELTEALATVDEGRLTLRTRWRALEASQALPLVRIDCGDDLITESQDAVWGGTHPFRAWQPGEIQSDLRYFDLPPQVTPDCLRVLVGATLDGSPLAASSPAGEALAEEGLLAQIEPAP